MVGWQAAPPPPPPHPLQERCRCPIVAQGSPSRLPHQDEAARQRAGGLSRGAEGSQGGHPQQQGGPHMRAIGAAHCGAGAVNWMGDLHSGRANLNGPAKRRVERGGQVDGTWMAPVPPQPHMHASPQDGSPALIRLPFPVSLLYYTLGRATHDK